MYTKEVGMMLMEEMINIDDSITEEVVDSEWIRWAHNGRVLLTYIVLDAHDICVLEEAIAEVELIP